MKKLLLFLIICTVFTEGFSQQIIDYGPLYGDSRYILGNTKWNKTELKYYIFNSSNHLTYNERESAIQNAFNTWGNNSELSFVQVTDSTEADLTIRWCVGNHGDGNPFEGPGTILAHAFFPPPASPYSGQLHFDDEENWSVGNTGIDLETVALHEIGHLLGIDHSDVQNATMYMNYNGLRRYLIDDDYLAVQDLYPSTITGSSILYDSVTYDVNDLPGIFSVSWSLSGNNASNFILLADTSSSNQCTINRKFGELFGDTTDLVLSAQIMHNGIVINTITKSLVTPHISGSSDPCGSTVYSIAKLPAGLSVDWSINPAVSIFFNSILTTNSPQPNQCTITNNGDRAWGTNLYAAIKNSVGDTIATLVKPVRSTFDLLFSQEGLYGYPTIPLSPVESNGNIIVNHKCLVDLVSPYFEGMTISHTGASPSIFDTSFDGHVTFRFPTITSTQYMTIHGYDGCKVMNLHVQVTPNGNIPIPMLEANPIPGGYEILLTYENDEEATRGLIDKEWTLNVVNASSSEKEISRQVKGQRTTISTANWKQGVYVLQGIVDGQECTKKIVVK